MPVSRWTWPLALALAAALFLSSQSRASAVCGSSGYSYAGLMSAEPAFGVAATVTALSPPRVENGHVGAWVGVGWIDAAPNGGGEWIQVGLSAFPGVGSRIYYEVMVPGEAPRYVELDAEVTPGESHRLAVLELTSRPDWWRVWVDGRPVGEPVYLPGSHGAWEPIATAESWDGGRPACNRFAYRFERLAVAARPGGRWKPLLVGAELTAPGYRLVRHTRTTFVAHVAA